MPSFAKLLSSRAACVALVLLLVPAAAQQNVQNVQNATFLKQQLLWMKDNGCTVDLDAMVAPVLTGPGQHRRYLFGSGVTVPSEGEPCSTLAQFLDEVAPINEACCGSTDATACAAGIPKSCDIDCAAEFLPFYGRCEGIISASLPDKVPVFNGVRAACDSLVPQMLRTCPEPREK